MSVEIITRQPCTACDGSGLVPNPRGGKLDCPNRCKRGVIVRKTTFADAAALRAVIHGSLESATYQTETWTGSPEFPPPVIHQSKMINLDKADVAVLAALGVSDDQSK